MDILALLVAVVAAFLAIAAGRANKALDLRMRSLEGTNRLLAGNLDRLERLVTGRADGSVEPSQPSPVETAEPIAADEQVPIIASEAVVLEPPNPDTEAPKVPEAAVAPKKRDWERLIGVTLPIWLGAAALSLAGFFFVRYAIESGAFTPAFRTIACAAAGLGFLAGADVVRRRTIANGAAIAGALAAAAIATLYAAVYLSSVAYPLIPAGAGFVFMAVVTALAIALALVFGQLVAFVGLLGGYLTPALYASDNPSALMLFGYLAAILVASFTVIRLKAWWLLSIPALVGPVLWILLWALEGAPDQQFWAATFTIIMPTIVLVAAEPFWRNGERQARLLDASAKGRTTPAQAVAISVLAASIGFVALLEGADYPLVYWQGAILLSLGTVILGFFWPRSLAYLKLYALAGAGLSLLFWDSPSLTEIAFATIMLGAIHGFGALDQLRRLEKPDFWAGAVAFVGVFFFAVALFKVTGWEEVSAQKHLRAALALLLGGAMTGLLSYFGPKVADAVPRDRVYAIFAAATSAFISLAIVLELDPVLFPAAASLQVLGLVAIRRVVPVDGLIKVAMAYAVLFGLLILGAESGVAAYDRDLIGVVLAKSVSDAPLVLLIVPGLAFIAAALLFPATPRRRFAQVLEVTGVLLLASGILLLGLPSNPLYLGEELYYWAARVTGPEMLLAAFALLAGERLARPALWMAGAMLSVIAAVVIAGTLVLPVYGTWPTANLGGAVALNWSLLALVPAAILMAVCGQIISRRQEEFATYLGRVLSVTGVVTGFTYVLLNIRFAFHPYLLQGTTESAEFYSYSVATLAFGAVLLIAGVAFRNLGARMLSFPFVLAATVKVFVFDAAALEGLWRVLSFLGMGLAFLAISWFYARAVFGLGRKKSEGVSGAA